MPFSELDPQAQAHRFNADCPAAPICIGVEALQVLIEMECTERSLLLTVAIAELAERSPT